jgi:MYXO-CTERM domain-containing protein
VRNTLAVGLATLILLGAPSAQAQVYGPYTFDANSWVTSASQTGTCTGYPSGTCAQNVVGHSPTVCAANIQCAPGSYIEIFFGNTTIVNNPGVDLVVFDSRFSTDPAAIAVETAPGMWTTYAVWGPDEQFLLAAGSGCDGATLAAVPVDLSRFGLPLGFSTKRIRVGGNHPTHCQFDLTMAGVPIGSPMCVTNVDCNDGNPCTNDACSVGSCVYMPSGASGCGPISVCGNAALEGGEGCDDGNAMAGDGCSNSCQVETGYECTMAGMPCSDIHECEFEIDNCDPNATCLNTPGSYTCTCIAGYEGDGFTCTDIDECALDTDICDPNATCTNTPGSFTCMCNMGYEGTGVVCTDINECSIGSHNCDPNATCTNTTGSFDCTCNMGYSGDGFTCMDIDECVLNTDDCDPLATCTNTPGSYTCGCNPGYEGNGAMCSDIDECALGTNNCHDHATCTNMPGSFTCMCHNGYYGDGVMCATVCGDGFVAGDESCDDGNKVNADGCNASCIVEEGWTCGGAPSVCQSGKCGDGIVEAVEGCDDGNSVSGDGCSIVCMVEANWVCEGQPSQCINPCTTGKCDADPDPVEEGSCACSMPGQTDKNGPLALAAGLLALAMIRGRRGKRELP